MRRRTQFLRTFTIVNVQSLRAKTDLNELGQMNSKETFVTRTDRFKLKRP